MKYDSNMPFTTENAAIIAQAMADGVRRESASEMLKVITENAISDAGLSYKRVHEIGEMLGQSEGIECAIEIFTNEAKFRETIDFFNEDTPST